VEDIMRRHLWAALVLLLIVLAFSAGTVGSAPNAPTVTLSPNPLILSVGATASLQVQVSGAQDLGAFEFIIAYDPAVVRVNGVTLGPLLGSTGNTATLLGPLVDNTAGTVRFAGYTIGTTAGPDGSGRLATIQLQGMGDGASTLNFTKVRVTNRAATVAAGATAINGSVVVGQGSGPRLWLPWVRRSQ
jgi:hypothetical protein